MIVISWHNKRKQIKASTCHKRLTNFITQGIEYTRQQNGIELVTFVAIGECCIDRVLI